MNRTTNKIINISRKIIPKYLHKPIYSICTQSWAFLRSRPAYLSDENFRNMPKRLENLQDVYSGKRCFIMGNGPSLNRMNLDLFSKEYVFASNKCYLLFDRISWKPSFYVAVDKRVVPDIATEINNLTNDLPATRFFFPAHFREKWIINSHSNVYWYPEVHFDENNLPNGMFTLDAAEWVSSVTTVTIAALQLAVYLGFNPIYLIGCDTSYSIPSTVKFERGNVKNITSTKNDDPNHFDSRYFGEGSKWHDPRVDRMIFHYQQAQQVCKSAGIKVFNATIGGDLEIFPRINYEDLFKIED